MALKQRVSNPRQYSAFRRTFNKDLPRLQHKFADGRMYLPEEEFCYGRKNRPSTPVGDVVSNYYGQKADSELS